MDRLVRLLKNPKTNVKDVESLLHDLLSQPDVLGDRELADYAQPCDLIRLMVPNLDNLAGLTLLINAARKMLVELKEKDIVEQSEYVVQMILTAPILSRSLINETLHLLAKANHVQTPGAKEIYAAVLGVIVGERFELPPEWWEVQAKNSRFPGHLFNAYIQMEGWEAVLIAFNLAAENKVILNLENLLVLVDVALTSFTINADKIWQLMEIADKLGGDARKKVEEYLVERLGGFIRGSLLYSKEEYKILEKTYFHETTSYVQ